MGKTPKPEAEILSRIRPALRCEEHNRRLGILETNIDPNERTLGEQSRHWLAAIVGASRDAIWSWTIDGTVISWNAEAERMFGYTPDEVIGQSLLKLLPPERLEAAREVIVKVGHGIGYDPLETVRLRKDGNPVQVELSVSPICDLVGRVVGAATICREITERKRIEAELRESEQRFRWLASIVESSDDAIVSKNLDGIITSWNRSAERIFGYTAEEAIGQPITIVIPQDRRDEERTILTRIRRGERIEHFETVRQRKHGSLIVVSLTVSPVKDAEGKIVGAAKIARDITEQKRSQEQIATLAREAEHRSKNLLATVQATVNLSQSNTPEGLKQAIEGRIQALANVHSLFVETRWIGAELSTIATQELAPYSEKDERQVQIEGPQILLEPNCRSGRCCSLARASDQRRQVRGSVSARRPDWPDVVARSRRAANPSLDGDGWSSSEDAHASGLRHACH